MLSVPGKMLEAIITKELFFSLKNHISAEQHGFFQGRSVITNLIPFVQYTLDSMDSRNQVDAVYADFSKAFDKVHHKTLLIKLENLGIHGDLLRWIKSYITNRSQCIKINGCMSKYVNITSGIPQGSHLGPLLFSLFINDITDCFLHTKFSLYADDLKIYKKITCLNDCIDLQSDLDRLINYCHCNRLFLNINKCYHISFTRLMINTNFQYVIDNNTLKSVDSIRDLGITLDKKCMFDLHIENIVKKALRMLGFILRVSKSFKNPASLISLYNSFVRSHLEFASIIWNPMYQKYIIRLEKVQIKFINHLNYRFNRNLHYENYDTSLSHYKLIKLSSRRCISYLIFLHKLLNGNIDSSFVLEQLQFNIRQYNSRSLNLFYANTFNTNYASNSPIRQIQNNYNCFFTHIDLFRLSLYSVKRLGIQVFS